VTQAEKADLIEVARRWLSVAHDFGSSQVSTTSAAT
jgi:hypothetical protein